MKTILVLSREYYDKSGYSVMKAYDKSKQNEANHDMEMLIKLESDFTYRLTEIILFE